MRPIGSITTSVSLALALISSLLSPPADAKRQFLVLIPNSGNVPGVEAIGHKNVHGSDGNLNQFGTDFAGAGRKWSTTFCYKDSDGDGQYNGAELGDPCCEWVQKTNERVAYDTVTDPGVSAKMNDPKLWTNYTCANGQTALVKYAAVLGSPAPAPGTPSSLSPTASPTSGVATPLAIASAVAVAATGATV
ncbi:hypothetical protein ATCC90586_007069 [Pythium insidiosum]|nr:hypothetical protein ATCC90586_007069 [Pythium insidiosum]